MEKAGMNVFQANICLLCVTFCWSTEVILFACIPDTVSSFATTCITSLVGGLLLFLCFARRIIETCRKHGRKLFKYVLALAIMNTVYNLLNISGLRYFDVSTGAFTLSMTVVILPVILLTLRQKTGVRTWLSAGLVFAGIIIVVIRNVSIGQGWGIVFMVIGCIVRAFYIVLLNKAASLFDSLALSSMISLSVGAIAFVPWIITQPALFAAIPWNKEIIASIAIYSYFIVALAQTLNIVAQKKSTPANATIIYSMEIVFSVIWGIILPASIITPVTLTWYILLGTALVVAGNIIEIVPVGRSDET
ncbi:Threonine/homoserine efflux transporter RhtA [Ruminococcaceae bacterium YRB3002]|nr:Threonine/homoserine efflux transporter RhtA [Ruminococcaceae bacterium YRB3002]